MTSPHWLTIVSALCSFVLPSYGQTNDWLTVARLTPGTSISVVELGRRGCELVKVTDSELFCSRQIAHTKRRLVFARERVREVRLENTEENRIITGAVIGGALGGLVGFLAGGQSDDPEARGYARAYGIPIGALLGGAIGKNFHQHGAVIYRRN